MRIAIVRSSYYEELLANMEQAARAVLHEAGVEDGNIRTVAVPGSFEIPLACKHLLTLRQAQDDSRIAGIIALGVIIQGETFHASEIARACTDGLTQLQLQYGVPIVHGVLYCKTMQQAQERCLGTRNRGEEAATTLLTMIQLLQSWNEEYKGA